MRWKERMPPCARVSTASKRPRAAKLQPRPMDSDPGTALVPLPRSVGPDSMAADLGYVGPRRANAPRFEVSERLRSCSPVRGNLEYGTLTNPLPVVTPHWRNQSLKPNFTPSFSFGARYMATEFTDIQLNWTHLRNTATDCSLLRRRRWWDRPI